MSETQHHDYHLVDPSPWPIVGSFSALFLAVGALFYIHDEEPGGVMLAAGFAAVLYTMYVWWRDVVREGEKGGHHTKVVRHGLRLGMSLFILSEVMFFFAFFWSFFKAALAPELVFDGSHIFEAGTTVVEGVFPPEGVETFNPWDLPLMNTLVLLLSGTTVTWAHYALLKDNRKDLITALTITVLLGLAFTGLQIIEDD
jgi:heme/copper-type cytochrome/quinol oxidase subunit 3